MYQCVREKYLSEKNGGLNEENWLTDGLGVLGKAMETIQWNHATLLFSDDEGNLAI
jgi:hypothetical protein